MLLYDNIINEVRKIFILDELPKKVHPRGETNIGAKRVCLDLFPRPEFAFSRWGHRGGNEGDREDYNSRRPGIEAIVLTLYRWSTITCPKRMERPRIDEPLMTLSVKAPPSRWHYLSPNRDGGRVRDSPGGAGGSTPFTLVRVGTTAAVLPPTVATPEGVMGLGGFRVNEGQTRRA